MGRVADLTVSLADPNPLPMIDRVLIRRPHAHDLLLPWSAVSAAQGSLSLTGEAAGFAIDSLAAALDDDEILLGRDVLDTQVVDIGEQRLARVADVVLARTPDGHMEVVGVEVGFGAVLRRLGLRALAARAGRDAVAWSDLHLTSDRGHAVQLATPRSAVHHLDARALATLVARLDTGAATAAQLSTRGVTGRDAERTVPRYRSGGAQCCVDRVYGAELRRRIRPARNRSWRALVSSSRS